MSELPNGWSVARLGDVCELINGRAYKQTELLASGKYPVLRVGNFFSNRNWYYSDLELEDNKYCDDGDLLYAWSASFGPRIWDGGKAIFHYHIWKTRLSEQAIAKRFLYHWFEWDKENIKAEHGTGSTMIHVTKGDMEARSLDLPPLPEQRRIVAKIDSLGGKSKRARNHLDHIPRLVEKYKQAVLAAAFRGALTREWRREQSRHSAVLSRDGSQIKPKYAEAGDFVPPYDLPGSWRWLRLPQLGDLDRGKSRHRPRNDKRLFGGTYPFIQTGEVRQADRFLTTYVETYSEFGLAQSRLWPVGTVCITIAANIAETAILGIDACFPDSVVGFLPDADKADGSYVEFFLRTAREELEAFAPATAQKNINLDILATVRVPTAPIAEQAEIVRRIEVAFAWIDRLASEATSARRLIDRLDQAVLAKAFRGELVPQDSADEPASVLLERISAERGVTRKTKRGRKTKVGG